MTLDGMVGREPEIVTRQNRMCQEQGQQLVGVHEPSQGDLAGSSRHVREEGSCLQRKEDDDLVQHLLGSRQNPQYREVGVQVQAVLGMGTPSSHRLQYEGDHHGEEVLPKAAGDSQGLQEGMGCCWQEEGLHQADWSCYAHPLDAQLRSWEPRRPHHDDVALGWHAGKEQHGQTPKKQAWPRLTAFGLRAQ